MIGAFKSLITFIRLYLMRKRQFDSRQLRQYFVEKHDIVVGMYSYGCFDRWRMPGPMRVGRYCSIAKTVRSSRSNHPTDGLTTHPIIYDPSFGLVDQNLAKRATLVLEDDVWIGHCAIILPGCTHIGRGAIIGAGAIVTQDVAPYTIVAGNPARKLRDRFPPDLIEAIEASRWWELEPADLRRLTLDDPDTLFSPTVARMNALCAKAAPR